MREKLANTFGIENQRANIRRGEYVGFELKYSQYRKSTRATLWFVDFKYRELYNITSIIRTAI